MSQLRFNGRFIKKSHLNKRERSMEALKKYRAKEQEQKEDKPPTDSATKPTKPDCILEGCRIIDIAYLTEQMSCDSCSTILCLSSIEAETKIGLASILKIRCANCSELKSVYTSRKVPGDNKRSYDINGRAATCSIAAGIDHKQLMKFLASIDVPFPSEATLKSAQKRKRQDDVPIAEDSSTKAVDKNKEPTAAASSAAELSDPVNAAGQNFTSAEMTKV